MKKEIKKVGILSLAKILVLFGVIIGLLMGIYLALQAQAVLTQYPEIASMSLSDPTVQEAITANPSVLQVIMLVKFGWWLVLLVPLLFAVLYFLSGLLLGWIYNLLARWVGGIKIELD